MLQNGLPQNRLLPATARFPQRSLGSRPRRYAARCASEQEEKKSTSLSAIISFEVGADCGALLGHIRSFSDQCNPISAPMQSSGRETTTQEPTDSLSQRKESPDAIISRAVSASHPYRFHCRIMRIQHSVQPIQYSPQHVCILLHIHN